VVVRDFDFIGVTVHPSKADAILVVDSDAVLSFPIASEPFETIPGGYAEFPEVQNPVQLCQLASCH
jgi:hypothetical protein